MITIDFTTKPKEIIHDYDINKFGTKCLYDHNGELHSVNDLPAVIYPDGTKYWYKHGKLHRNNDLPAVICPDGTKGWFKHGLKHRENNLPAVMYSWERKEYWANGKKIK